MTGVLHDQLSAGDLWILDLLVVAASASFGLAAAQTRARDTDPDDSPTSRLGPRRPSSQVTS